MHAGACAGCFLVRESVWIVVLVAAKPKDLRVHLRIVIFFVVWRRARPTAATFVVAANMTRCTGSCKKLSLLGGCVYMYSVYSVIQSYTGEWAMRCDDDGAARCGTDGDRVAKKIAIFSGKSFWARASQVRLHLDRRAAVVVLGLMTA